MDHKSLEEGSELALDYEKLRKAALASAPVLPVAVQDADTREVLIVAYANEQALRYTPGARGGRLLEHLAKRVVGQGGDLWRYLAARRGARQLRAELAALPGRAAGQGRVPYQGRRAARRARAATIAEFEMDGLEFI